MTTTTSFRSSVKEMRQVPTSLALHVLFSLLAHLAQLTLSALLAFALYRDVTHRDVFFALTSGLTILPLVTLQLLSAIFLLRSRGDSMSGREAVVRAGVHVLQLGFLWRHLDLLQPKENSVRYRDLKELQLLRMVFALIGGFPLLLLQLYLMLVRAEFFGWTWLLPVSLSVSAVSCVWTVVNFRTSRQQQQQSGRGNLWLKFGICVLWRAGEVVSRMISLGLFAYLFQQWVLGILGMHWVVMVICLSLPYHYHHPPFTAASSCPGKALLGLIASYSVMWCYVTVRDVRVWCLVYYVIVFLENGSLCVVWLIRSEADGFVFRYLPVAISGLAFLLAMMCLAVHRRHFPMNLSSQGLAKAGPPQVIGNRSFRDWDDHQKCKITPKARHSHASPPRQNLLYFAASMGGSGGANETDTEGHGSWLIDAERRNSWLTDAEGRNSWLTEAKGRNSWLTDAEGRNSWLTDAKGRGFCLAQTEGCCSRLTGADGRGSWLSGTGGHGSWVDHTSDCLSINTTSTAHPPLHTVLERGCGNSGRGMASGCGRYRSPSSSSCCAAVPSCDYVDMGQQHPTSSSSLYAFTKTPIAHPLEHMQKANRDRPHSDGYSTDHTILEWSKLPVTPLADNVWHIHDTDTTDCCYSYLSPGESEASCTMPGSGLDSCPRERLSAGDAVYGIPRQMVHLPQKERPQKAPSLDLQTCAYCLQQQQKNAKDLYTPSSIFTIPSHSRHCSSYRDYVNMSVPHSDGSDQNIYRVVKKNKQLGRRKLRGQQYHISKSLSNSRNDRRLSLCSSIVSSTELGSVSTICSRSRERKERDIPIPARLQVRAILPESEDIPVKIQTGSASEPVYENVPILEQENLYSSRQTQENPLKKKQGNPCSSREVQENSWSLKKARENPYSTSSPQITTVTTDNFDKSTMNTNRKTNTDQHYVNTDIRVHHDYQFNRKSYERQQRRLKKPTELKDKDPQKMKQLQVQMNTNETSSSRPLGEAGREKDRVRSSGSGGYSRQWLCAGTHQEVGGMCSESEDSALPTETFSSSVEDGCLGTDLDSEDNVEFII